MMLAGSARDRRPGPELREVDSTSLSEVDWTIIAQATVLTVTGGGAKAGSRLDRSSGIPGRMHPDPASWCGDEPAGLAPVRWPPLAPGRRSAMMLGERSPVLRG